MKNPGYTSGYITYDDEATWLVTYADLMTLLMVFFVLLYSLAAFDRERYKATMAGINEAIRENEQLREMVQFISRPGGFDQQVRIDDITGLHSRDSALYRSMEKMVENSAGAGQLSLDARNGKLVVTISGEALFASGSARLYPSSQVEIDRMVDLFQEYGEYNINIKGHTDNVPISTREFPSNWELSAIRATTVLKHLISRGVDPDRLTATGYGEIMPLASNTTPENRAKNRRVEFVLEKKEIAGPR